MTRRVVILVCVLAGSLALTASASAATTWHGSFTSGVGYKVGSTTPLTLDTFGSWNVNVGSNGVQVTGMVSVARQPCRNGSPCPFELNFGGKGSWTGDVSSGFDRTFYLGEVRFDLHLSWTGAGVATLRAEITNCPYSWDYWVFTGTTTRG